MKIGRIEAYKTIYGFGFGIRAKFCLNSNSINGSVSRRKSGFLIQCRFTTFQLCNFNFCSYI